jgi:ketosteroid isomerase-like protein
MKALLGSLLLTVALVLSPVAMAADADNDATAKELAAKYDQTLNSHNLDGLVSLFAEDAIYVPGIAPGGVGHDVIRQSYGPVLNSLSNHHITIQSTQQTADNVLTIKSSWVVDMKDKDGKVNHLHGDSVAVWAKDGDDWKIKALGWSDLTNWKPPQQAQQQ